MIKVKVPDDKIRLIWVDLFCGGGGTSTGIEKDPYSKVIIGINHDKNSILTHSINHPEIVHFTEDIRTVSFERVQAVIDKARERYPNAELAFHASLECTQFSDAKGGGPKDADSRSLAEDMPRYQEYFKPAIFTIENVREFMRYGPLDEHNHVIKGMEGTYYTEWVEHMKSLNGGYHFDYKLLTAADYGAVTIRRRYFAIFSKKQEYIQWPEITHVKGVNQRAVAEVLELNDKGKSIFAREKPYVEATLRKIYNGLVSYKEQYLILYKGKSIKGLSIRKPCGSLTNTASVNLVSPEFLITYYGKGKNFRPISEPAATVTTKDRMNLCTPVFLLNPQWGNDSGWSIKRPCFTLIARMDKACPLIVSTVAGSPHWEIKETDSHYTKLIKQFMKENWIADIFMRPLNIRELLQIQGFPPTYVLRGTLADQKKQIGNSVETTTMYRWVSCISAMVNVNEKRIRKIA